MNARPKAERLLDMGDAAETVAGQQMYAATAQVYAMLAVAEELAGIRAVFEETAPRAGEAGPRNRRWAVWHR